MSISINFRSTDKEFTNRNLPKSTGISIYGKASTLTGFINPGTQVTIDIFDVNGLSYFTDVKTTDFFGDYDFYFTTPNKDVRLTLKLVVDYSVSGQDVLEIPISIGDINPSPMPLPDKPGDFPYWILPVLGVVALIGFIEFRK